MPHELGCCLQGNPKTEVTGSVADSKETNKTMKGKDDSPRAAAKHSLYCPGDQPGKQSQVRRWGMRWGIRRVKGTEEPWTVGSQMAVEANSFMNSKSTSESPFRVRAH